MNRLALATPASDMGSTVDIGSVDQLVSQRIRRRRILLGMTQQALADSTGITCQQAHKYEKGLSRISSERLYQIAQALSVKVSYFFDEADPTGAVQSLVPEHAPHQRKLLELARNFTMVKSRKHQEAICCLARALGRRDEKAP